MNLPRLNSINRVQFTYGTGERPVLVDCDDFNSYICKYRRSAASGYKLVGELVGSVFAKVWHIPTPPIALVEMRAVDQSASMMQLGRCRDLRCFGSRMIPHTVDITGLSADEIPVNPQNCIDLIKVAIFDLWLGNEDRNSNNANLLYDVVNDRFLAIDHGCIFNTADYGHSPYLLTENESIIDSPLVKHLLRNHMVGNSPQSLEYNMKNCLENCRQILDEAYYYIRNCERYSEVILGTIPSSWEVEIDEISESLKYVFEKDWIDNVFNVSKEYLMNSFLYEK